MADYQVFISFKNAEPDVVMAEALYRELKQRGIKAFFSKYSIDEAARADYVDVIDEALDSALLLVAVGASKKNLTSKWVKAEINQFRTLMNSEEDGRRSLASYRAEGYPESELPSGLKSYQSFSDLNALVRFIEVFFGKVSAFQKNEEITTLLSSAPVMPDAVDIGDLMKRFSAKSKEEAKTKEPEDKAIQVGDLVNEKYRILSKVGQGGMSVVYLAIDEKTKCQYAVKEIRGSSVLSFDVVMKSFRGEVDMMKKLKHPAIPRIYDVIESQNSVILVMDFINGLSLQRIITDSGPVDEKMVLNYARQLCEVFAYLHSQPAPVIYRDMKPANVIVLPDGNIKLIDFGVARYYSAEPKAEDTTCLGTIGYAAPEQFGGMGQSDARTDIYNLGATLYHLVTGKSPSAPPYEILPIRQVNPELSRGLEAIILRCTQRDPDQRFQSAVELLDALENIKKFAWQESVRTFFGRKSGGMGRVKTKIAAPQKAPTPVPSQLQTPDRLESMHETTVLPPPQEAFVAPPAGGCAQPVAPKPPVTPTPPKPQTAPTPSFAPAGFHVPGTPGTTPPAPGRRVTPVPPEKLPPPIPPRPSPGVPMDDTIKKLQALDPDAQRLVRDLINRLSK
ncbi:MAG: protein kinase [Oscillospiraceae bacterium]|nr:protein kinase [Oscillospiraceae bacterium]